MTIYTFYRHDNQGQVHIAGTLDSDSGEYSGDYAKVLKEMIDAARLDITKQEDLFGAFYDSSRLWIREGEPFEPLVERQRAGKAPKMTFSRSEET